MKRFLQKTLLAAALVSVQLSGQAVDLDLYTNGQSTNQKDLPNVLFIIDNTANWNQPFSNEMSAIANTLANLPENKFNVGIMFSSETGAPNTGNEGGYIRAAIRKMDTANKAKYVTLVNSFDKIADKGNGGASGLQIAEAWAYFKGIDGWGGWGKAKTDYDGNTTGSAASKAIYDLDGNALASFSSKTYKSPILPGSCAKNYIIYISNGANQQNNSANTKTNALLAAAGGSTAQIALSPSGSADNPADEWTRFMKKSELGIITYTIDVNPVTNGQGPGWTALLKSMSGLSNYRAVTSGGTQIEDAINDMLSRIQSVNSVFAAVSLPASATVQGAYLNQLYVGMFRPDELSLPRWSGNIKQYKRGSDGLLADADNKAAINTETGFVAECARSYWTPTALDSYWSEDPKGKCIPSGADGTLYAKSNSPDGNIVEKGAQGFMLRAMTPAARKVYTCKTSACNALDNFSTSTASLLQVGLTSALDHSALIDWAKGKNVDAELLKPVAAMRPSAHGDVIHSNPLALSYGSDVVVYYGSNDGMLHAINGNQTADIGSVAAGGEIWSFVPPEFFGSLKRLRTNTEKVNIAKPLDDEPSTGSPKPYSVDGPISAFKYDSKTYIYTAMRRGGRALYAFDVTDKAAPLLKWRVGCPTTGNLAADDLLCTSGTKNLGQTWSTARAVRASGYQSGTGGLLVMGGGYDNCEDADINTCSADSKGDAVFVLDALNGTVLKELKTDRPVAGDVRIIPDESGLAKYGYVADLGGNLYRITMGSAAPGAWTIVKIAALGCDTALTTCKSNRKFMFGPSAILEDDGSISLYLGSGDREKPLNDSYYPKTPTVENYFFKVTDKPSDAGWLTSEAANCNGVNVMCLASLSSTGDTDESTATACGGSQAIDKKGWYLGLRDTEQVVTPAATRFGITTFSTHMPVVKGNSDSCKSNLGTVHVYNLDINTASPVRGSCSSIVTGGGLPPPPEKMDICINASCTETRATCIGCSDRSSIELLQDGEENPGSSPNTKRRVYWYIQQ